MVQNKFGEMIFNEDDICDLVMSGQTFDSANGMLVDTSVKLENLALILDDIPRFLQHDTDQELSQQQYDDRCQNNWYMPDEYRRLDIAEHVLGLCTTDAELQRCGQELLLFQEKNLFDVLRYLKYLVDTMSRNHLIWGVGRGSSVASFVLYKIGVHRVDSLYYDLDIKEFLK